MTVQQAPPTRCAIVTGAGRGLGRGYALALGRTGAANHDPHCLT